MRRIPLDIYLWAILTGVLMIASVGIVASLQRAYEPSPAAISTLEASDRATSGSAMAAYRADNPTCEWCGTKRGLEVHHLLPVLQSPDAAASLTNFMTLCRRDHMALGHPKGTKKYCSNLRALLALREIKP